MATTTQVEIQPILPVTKCTVHKNTYDLQQLNMQSLSSLGHGSVKELQELPEGGLIHDVDQTHLHDQEVEDAAACGHGTELFARRVDLDLCVCCNLQFLADIAGCHLGDGQHVNQLVVIHKGTLHTQRQQALFHKGTKNTHRQKELIHMGTLHTQRQQEHIHKGTLHIQRQQEHIHKGTLHTQRQQEHIHKGTKHTKDKRHSSTRAPSTQRQQKLSWRPPCTHKDSRHP